MKKKLSIKVITLFPDFINSYLSFGIIKKAIKAELLEFQAINLRKFAPDARGTVDDRPYGGELAWCFGAMFCIKLLKI